MGSLGPPSLAALAARLWPAGPGHKLTGRGRAPHSSVMDYATRITIEPGKRGGKPCIRGLRITVYDVLEYLARG